MNTVDLRNRPEKRIFPLDGFHALREEIGGGACHALGFTNYYMTVNDRPFPAVSGEFHYARCDESRWEDELIKLKEGGCNIVSTYIFWIHHEEREGVFDFSGRRDLRRFVTLCDRVGLMVIIRIGPFDHGEVRNGGFPDWLYGKDFDPRTLDEGFLFHVRRLYGKLGEQLSGLYFKDGGPIIAAQLDNEYEHSSAGWEQTTGISNEWITAGKDGNAYLLKLKELALDAGIDVPFYTCTAWGGAATPEELMPLWGGYCYRPWLFYSYRGEHPATGEFHYSDFHNNALPRTPDFDPFYEPEDRPYACCEMGGGMMNCYYYRFILDYRSVDAMANIKLASGCNFPGYYMYQGGTNPKGASGTYLNESQVPKLSYDYQAALGEFGQERDSFRRLRTLHLFIRFFGADLLPMETVLPEGAREIDPRDLTTLRFAVRQRDGHGFLFLNNFQDHVTLKDRQGDMVRLETEEGPLSIGPLSLAAGENAILPFNLELKTDGAPIVLQWSTAQPAAFWQENGVFQYLFFLPEGMQERFVFADSVRLCLEADSAFGRHYLITEDDRQVRLLLMTRERMNRLSVLERDGRTLLILTSSEGTPDRGVALLPDEDRIRVESSLPEVLLTCHPSDALTGAVQVDAFSGSLVLRAKPDQGNGKGTFSDVVAACTPSGQATTEAKDIPVAPVIDLKPQQIGESRYALNIPEGILEGVKDVILEIRYEGDIGSLFADGELIHDNFANGAVWEYSLRDAAEYLQKTGGRLVLYITPLREGARVNVESAMAARSEEADSVSAGLLSVCIRPVYEHTVRYGRPGA